jgi:hypothetical protein
MFVQVRLLKTRAEPPLLIPGDCVITTAKGLCVAVLEDIQLQDSQRAAGRPARSYLPQAKQVHLQEIQVGRDCGQEIEVVSGLQGWEHVVLNPGDEIGEGAVVQPVAGPRSEGAGGQRRPSATNGGAAPKAEPGSR